MWRADDGAWIPEFHVHLSYKSVASLWVFTALLYEGTDLFSKLIVDQ